MNINYELKISGLITTDFDVLVNAVLNVLINTLQSAFCCNGPRSN